MPLWDKSGTRPTWLTKEEKRNVIATNDGWVNRIVSGSKVKNEILVSIGNLDDAVTMNNPSIAEVYVANSTGGSTLKTGLTHYVYTVYDEPVSFEALTPQGTITISNTASGDDVLTAIMNDDKTTIINANNTVRYEFSANTAGTYKVEAQTIANSANIYSLNATNETANLVISGAVSNALATFIIS